tara:strand:+ start:2922 stop:4271 length:1350 start_codon:yes stop_codon:yes gene_type:complete
MPKKKKKIQKFNVENILKGMELDLMLAGKIPGEEGSSIVGRMQLRRNLAEMPQGGGITPLMPISPLDLAFETLATGLAHAEGVDPRLAIAGSIAASRYGPSAARAVNVKGGAYLSRRAYRKGMESASKDPMFADIDYSKEVKFIDAAEARRQGILGSYHSDVGLSRRHKELYPNYPFYHQVPSIHLAERTLGELLSLGHGKYPKVPQLFTTRDWAEGTVRHESRHYMQNVEGMKRVEVAHGAGKGESPIERIYGHKSPHVETPKGKDYGYGYPADRTYGGEGTTPFSTLIEIPKPRNPYPAVSLEYINKQGLPEHPYKVFKKEAKKHGEKYANKYIRWYKEYTEWDTPVFGTAKPKHGKEYFQRPIEVEARIEEISAFGDKNISSAKNIKAFKELKHGAGYSTEQILDMVTKYRIAKKKYHPAKYRAQAQEFKKPSKDFLGEKIKAKHW